MRCPTCKKEFHSQPDHIHTYCLDEYYDPSIDSMCTEALICDPTDYDSELLSRGCEFLTQKCPSCAEVMVIRKTGRGAYPRATPTQFCLIEEDFIEIIYPKNEHFSVASEVPDEYRNDFLEASGILVYSPKASAALSRRLLQKVLREALGIKKRDLSQEIDEFISNAHAPSYLNDAVDAIRQIGNFAAHPIKYTNSGEIVEVEAGEAEWLLEVMESLFDFAFIQPIKLEKRRQILNDKLETLGKPKLKGS